jgi:hypothetical protein
MTRWIDMTAAQKTRLDIISNTERRRRAPEYVAAAESEVNQAKARLAAQPNSKLRARSLSDAEARLSDVRREFGMGA